VSWDDRRIEKFIDAIFEVLVNVLWFVLALAVGLGVAWTACATEIRPSTWAFDYRNVPNASKVLGYEIVALSARGALTKAADTLRAEGSRVVVWMQPTAAAWGGVLIGSRVADRTQYPWDSALYDSALAHGAILRDSTGALLRLFPADPNSPIVLDFANPAFVRAYVAAVSAFYGRKGDGVLLDYACGDLGWAGLKVRADVWPAWRAGYLAFIDQLNLEGVEGVQCQCDQWATGLTARCSGILHERAGWSLNPSPKVWASVAYHPRTWIRVEDRIAQRRRLFAAMALVTDSPFNWSALYGEFPGYPAREDNLRNVEHFDLWMGRKLTGWYQVAANVFQRNYSLGFAVVNLSSAPVKIETRYTLAPQDGFVAQIRDRSGRFIRWRTNQP
jgi:hypothetical protein